MKALLQLWLFWSFLWLASTTQADIHFITTEEPPTNYTENGQLVGITTDIVIELQKRLNMRKSIDVIPWARAYRIAQTQPNVLIFTAGKTPEREALGFHFIGPVSTRSHILISRKDAKLTINSVEDIKEKKLEIGAMRGDWREKYFLDNGINVQSATNHYVVLKMLAAGRIPLAVTSDLELPALAKLSKLDSALFKTAYEFQRSDSYILFSKGTPTDVVAEWRNEFKDLQRTGFLEETAKKWSAKLNLNLKYSQAKGFHVEP